MHRSVGIAIAVVGLAALLVAPACAVAGGPWVVKNASGRETGSVRVVSATKAIYIKGGREAGEINRTGRGKWTAFTLRLGGVDAVHVHHAALWGKSPAWQLRGFAEMGPLPLAGRIVRRSGRWIVQSVDASRGWRKRGSVARSCPAWAAGGAVFLISPRSF